MNKRYIRNITNDIELEYLITMAYYQISKVEMEYNNRKYITSACTADSIVTISTCHEWQRFMNLFFVIVIMRTKNEYRVNFASCDSIK